MKESDNIEKLFKDTFEHFEAEVNPQAWANIQSGMKAASGSGTASAGAKFAAGKVVAGLASVALISASVWYLSPNEVGPVKTKSAPSEIQQPEIIASQEVPAIAAPVAQGASTPEKNTGVHTNTYSQVPPAIRTLNHYSSDNSVQQTKVPSATNDPAVYSDVEALEQPASSSQPVHKYGNATQGDGGMIRGTQGTYTPFSNSQNSSENNQNENTDNRAVAISVSTSYGDAPLSVDFYNQGGASSLVWDFGDGTYSRDNSPKHTFDKPGNYVVKLTARNASGTHSDIVNIEVKSISSVTNIPNIFTPNGDGENDLFLFDIKNISSIGVAILSHRTGEVITQWNNLDGNWNGKLKNGADAPAGVYLYSIQAIGSDDAAHSEKGFVTISR